MVSYCFAFWVLFGFNDGLLVLRVSIGVLVSLVNGILCLGG